MNDKSILKNQLETYKFHKPSDIYKLIYQGEFGGGHIISDVDRHLTWLKKEMNDVKNRPLKHVEAISETYARIYLDGLMKTSLNIHTLEKMILISASNNRGDLKAFEKKLTVWKSLEDVAYYCDDMKQQNYPLVHHSELYRNHYQPAYRIIDLSFAFYLNLIMTIDLQLAQKKRVVIAIDGDAGSGKSALANLLSKLYDQKTIQMDDFFLQDHQRTVKRLNEVGGHIDYERFSKSVIKPLIKEQVIKYRPYNCQTHTFMKTIEVNQKPLVIIEGSYSMRPEFLAAYDIKVVLKVSKKIQHERIKKRSGKQLYERFVNEWIPKEKAYFKMFHIAEKADFVFDTSFVKMYE